MPLGGEFVDIDSEIFCALPNLQVLKFSHRFLPSHLTSYMTRLKTSMTRKGQDFDDLKA
jgi:hypothetical protein